jgi:Flp pilus assembly protein TadD
VDDLEKRAEIILALGQSAEVMRDYGLAVNFYRHALAHEPTDKTIWFFIHNNLGYSLMQLADFAEAEKFCRAATQIDPGRPNGHKNLGLAFQGQGRSREAAACFVAATQANAADARALGHLEALLAAHPELAAEFGAQLECCRQAVAVAREANAQAEAAWKRPPG